LGVSRRGFLRFLAAAGVTSIAGYTLYEYAPWLDVDAQANKLRQHFAEDSMSNQTQQLVHFATLAANGHNTQPWKFVVSENLIEIHPDEARRLTVADPQDRELWISLGTHPKSAIQIRQISFRFG
jgi:hypothetical protein